MNCPHYLIRSYVDYEAPFSARAKTIGGNSSYLLIGFDGTQKINGNTVWGASKLMAVELESGTVVWETRIPGSRSVDIMNLCGKTVGVNGSYSSNTYLLDVDTGTTLQKNKQGDIFIWFTEDHIEYRTQKGYLIAYNTVSDTNLWSIALNEAIFQPIQCQSDVLVVRTNRGTHRGNVYAIDKITGDIMWHIPNTISNIDSNEYHVFFMIDDTLVAVDTITGELIDTIMFSSEITPSNNITNGPSHIAVDEHKVFVYFGDSRQLFAFQFDPPPVVP